jgi:hypothetical protein
MYCQCIVHCDYKLYFNKEFINREILGYHICIAEDSNPLSR